MGTENEGKGSLIVVNRSVPPPIPLLLCSRAVLIEGPNLYIKAGTAFFPGSRLAGNGLLVSDGKVWQRQRQLSNPAFRRAAVEKYAQVSMQMQHPNFLV